MLRALGALGCALTVACGSTAAPPAGVGGSSAGGGAGGGASSDCATTFDGVDAPVFDPPIHRFRFFAGQDWVQLEGAAFDAPALSFHGEAAREGACRLLTYEPAFCDPVCSDGQVCIEGTCTEQPMPISAGTLQLQGVGDSVVTLEPDSAGHYYWSTQAFSQDTVHFLELAATGAEAPAFEASTCMVGPPEPTEDWSMRLEARAKGEDVVLRWSNPLSTARVYLRMTTGIGTHGGISPVEIECEGRDRGALTLPGSYLDALYAKGWGCGECGNNQLLRYHADRSGSGADTVELRAESGASFWFRP